MIAVDGHRFRVLPNSINRFLINNQSKLQYGADGSLTVTDADRIELSNLARQFLFREHNVGHAKSVAACAMAAQMNPALKNIKALEMFVGPKTEDTFHDAFWTEHLRPKGGGPRVDEPGDALKRLFGALEAPNVLMLNDPVGSLQCMPQICVGRLPGTDLLVGFVAAATFVVS